MKTLTLIDGQEVAAIGQVPGISASSPANVSARSRRCAKASNWG